MSLLGGLGTFAGPAVGAAVVLAMQTYLASSALPIKDVVREGRQTYTERRAAGGNPVADYGKRVPGQVRGLVGEVILVGRDVLGFDEDLVGAAHLVGHRGAALQFFEFGGPAHGGWLS